MDLIFSWRIRTYEKRSSVEVDQVELRPSHAIQLSSQLQARMISTPSLIYRLGLSKCLIIHWQKLSSKINSLRVNYLKTAVIPLALRIARAAQ